MVQYDDKPWLKWYDEGVKPSLNAPGRGYVGLHGETINRFPSRTAFHFLGSGCSYGGLDRLSRSFAGFLQSRRVGPGESLGICLPNTPQYLIALVGALRYRCAVSGVSPLLSPKEMEHQLDDAGIRVLGKLLDPKRIEFVEAMPLTIAGKVDKKALKQGAAK